MTTFVASIIGKIICAAFGHGWGRWIDGAPNTGSQFYQFRKCWHCGEIEWRKKE